VAERISAWAATFLGLSLGDPRADHDGVVQACPVMGDLLIEIDDPGLGRLGSGVGVASAGCSLVGE
jgi:hypothetical protein